MGRFLGKGLILLTIVLVLANAQCFARCLVQPCDQSPTSCHSHGKGNSGQCPQSQLKAGATNAAVDWGVEFIPVGQPVEIMPAQQLAPLQDSSLTPQPILKSSPPLRI